MINLTISSLLGDFSAIDKASNSEIEQLKNEVKNGVVDNSSKLVSFKVEQKIINIESSNKLNIGAFVNSNSRFKKLKTHYLMLFLSNKKEDLKDSFGNVIATKQYGIGLGLVLDVKNIETKVNGNYGVLAASAKLNFAKVSYKLEVYGIEDPTLLANLPNTSGDFSFEAFKKISDFIKIAKVVLKNTNLTKQYPIEVIKKQDLNLEKSDIKSIYFGVRKVAEGISLNRAILTLRNGDTQLGENVVHFIYRYFELNDAYADPTETQKQNASKWLNAQFNKISDVGVDGSWVNIDSTYTGEIGDTNKNFKPHPKPSDWTSLAKTLKDEFSMISADFSSDLKIAAIADVETNFNSVVITRDIALFVDTSQDRPDNSQVIETRYGVGIRLMVKLTSIEFGTDVNFGAVGAISELSLANVEYSISGIGFADKSFLAELPGPQNITQETIKDLNKSLDKIKTKLSKMSVDDLNPQAYKIRVMEPDEVDPTIEAQAFVFSTGQIQRKIKLEETLIKAREIGLKEEMIKKAYSYFHVNGNDKVTKQQKDNAKNWLTLI